MARLSDAEISSRLAKLTGWRREGPAITRTYEFASFRDAVFFVNTVAGLAEAANHHPDIDIRWRRVTLTLSTHSEGGLTEKDFDLAETIEAHTRRWAG